MYIPRVRSILSNVVVVYTDDDLNKKKTARVMWDIRQKRITTVTQMYFGSLNRRTPIIVILISRLMYYGYNRVLV